MEGRSTRILSGARFSDFQMSVDKKSKGSRSGESVDEDKKRSGSTNEEKEMKWKRYDKA